MSAPAATAPSATGAVVFRLGSSRYAVAMTAVAEVCPVPRLTRVPHTPPWVAGVANWRGRVLPVVDLRPLLRLPAALLGTGGRLLVLGGRSLSVGVVAESVAGVLDPMPVLAPVPATLGPDVAALLVGQVIDDHGPLAVVDPDAVLALGDRLDRRATR